MLLTNGQRRSLEVVLSFQPNPIDADKCAAAGIDSAQLTSERAAVLNDMGLLKVAEPSLAVDHYTLTDAGLDALLVAAFRDDEPPHLRWFYALRRWAVQTWFGPQPVPA